MMKKIISIVFIITISLHSYLLPGAATAPAQAFGFDIGGFHVTPQEMIKVVTATAEAIEKSAQTSRKNREKAIKALEEELIDLGKKRDQKKIGDAQYDLAKNILNNKIVRIEQLINDAGKSVDKMSENVQKVALDGWQTVLNNYKEKEQRKTNIAVAAVAKAVENEGLKEKTKIELEASMERLKYMSAPDNLKKYSIFLSLSTLGVMGSYYAVKRLDSMFDKKPILVRETSYKGWRHELSAYLSSFLWTPKPQATLEDAIFSFSLEKEIRDLATATKTTKDKGLEYRHVLLYGPPGTGKTHLARIFSQISGMHYVIISGADFTPFQEGQDVQALHDLLDWAESLEGGLIIFIDEADAFLRKRSMSGERWIRLLDAFLKRTGTSSPHFMLIFATNHPEVLDDAIHSRVHKEILIPLPAQPERERQMNLYINKYIKNDKRTIKLHGKTVEVQLQISEQITPGLITTAAEQINGFSGRQIEQMIAEMRIASYMTDDLRLSHTIFIDTVNEALTQHKKKQALTALSHAT